MTEGNTRNSLLENTKSIQSKVNELKTRRSKHNKRTFICPYKMCEKSLKGKMSMKVHLRSHLKEKPFKCEFSGCSSSFTTKGNLKAHTFLHKNIKPFVCSQPGCNKKYINECRLRVHERTHLGLKPFECKYCSKLFNEKGNLKTHMRIHTGERPFKCPREDCNSAFKTRGHLKDHMKIHMDIKPFQCPTCLKQYSRPCTLKIHMRIHTGEKPYQCAQEGCGKTFTEKGNMKNHVKKHFKNSALNKTLRKTTTTLEFISSTENEINNFCHLDNFEGENILNNVNRDKNIFSIINKNSTNNQKSQVNKLHSNLDNDIEMLFDDKSNSTLINFSDYFYNINFNNDCNQNFKSIKEYDEYNFQAGKENEFNDRKF